MTIQDIKDTIKDKIQRLTFEWEHTKLELLYDYYEGQIKAYKDVLEMFKNFDELPYYNFTLSPRDSGKEISEKAKAYDKIVKIIKGK